MNPKLCSYRIESIPNDKFFSVCSKAVDKTPVLLYQNWNKKYKFMKQLRLVEQYFSFKKKFKSIKQKNMCIYCNKEIYNTIYFIYKDVVWKNDLSHYIENHNYMPSNNFIQIIAEKHNKISTNNKNKLIFITLSQNKLSIIDAVMNHGGNVKRYLDRNNVYRYSEHYGVLLLKHYSVDKISVYSEKYTSDQDDPDIILPDINLDIMKYDYLFHTHPPTPKAGSRASQGILYEFPSINDILNFIDNYNFGNIQGSLVMTPEGLYYIRKYILDNKKIKINEKKFVTECMNMLFDLQTQSILKYGTSFNTYYFYSKIAQDTSFIHNLNNFLKKFMIYIDYFPRSKKNGKWVVETIQIPFFKKK